MSAATRRQSILMNNHHISAMSGLTKPRLFVTGGSGFLGSHLIPLALQKWEVHYVVHEQYSKCTQATGHKMSLNNFHETEEKIRLLRPDHILHLAVSGNANYCEQFPWNSWKINVETSALLANIAFRENIPFTFTSTDMVFDGTKGNYIESDAAFPINKYGAQKLEAEKLVQKLNANALVLRLPLMFGNPTLSGKSFLTDMIRMLSMGEKVYLFTDEFRSVCGAESVANGILNLMGHATGVIHLGGTQSISRYDFGLMAAKIFGCDTSLIYPCLQSDKPMLAPRPKDVTLNSGKAIYLGFRALSIDEELRLIANAISHS